MLLPSHAFLFQLQLNLHMHICTFPPDKYIILVVTQLRDIDFLCTLPHFIQESLLLQDHTMQGAGKWQRLFPTNSRICSSYTVQKRHSLPPLPGLGTIFLESSLKGLYVWQRCKTLVKFREMPSFTKQSHFPPPSNLRSLTGCILTVLSLKPFEKKEKRKGSSHAIINTCGTWKYYWFSKWEYKLLLKYF